MRREPLKYGFFFIACLMLALEVWLLVSGDRLLISETYVPEQDEVLGSFSVAASEAKYRCSYFTGRKKVFVELSSFRYEECPFIWREGRDLE